MSVLFSVALFINLPVRADDYSVTPLKEGPPADAISAEITAQLAPVGTRVTRDGSRTLCDIWLCKEWVLKGFQPPSDVLYPFQPGQLIGVIRLPRKLSDFRGQDISSGTYTLRYAQQPVDGAHVGTSPTRDFLLLVESSKDQLPAVVDYDTLTENSADAAGSSHPALMSMQRTLGDEVVRHQDDMDWWIVRLASKAKAGEEVKQLAFDLVVFGQAVE